MNLLHEFFNHASDANEYLTASQQEKLEAEFQNWMLSKKPEVKKDEVKGVTVDEATIAHNITTRILNEYRKHSKTLKKDEWAKIAGNKLVADLQHSGLLQPTPGSANPINPGNSITITDSATGRVLYFGDSSNVPIEGINFTATPGQGEWIECDKLDATHVVIDYESYIRNSKIGSNIIKAGVCVRRIPQPPANKKGE
jgi:hypothetical protein